MRMTIPQSILAKTLGNMLQVVEKKSVIPALGCVLIEANSDGKVLLSVCDLDILLKAEIAAEVALPGKIVVQAHLLNDIVRKSSADQNFGFQVDYEERRLTLKFGRSKFRLPVLDAEDFPVMSPANDMVEFPIRAGVLQRMLYKSAICMSTEETRYYLNGVFLTQHRNTATNITTLRAVATDSHRMAIVDSEMPAGAENAAPVIVPRKTVGIMSKLLSVANDEEVVSLSVNETKVLLKVGEMTLLSKAVDAKFPNYIQVVNLKTERAVFNLKVDEMAAAVGRVTTISDERTRLVDLKFAEGAVNIFMRGQGNSEAVEVIDLLDASNQKEAAITFNSRYLSDLMDRMSEKGDLSIGIINDAAPCHLQELSDPDTLYILMPCRAA